MAKPSTPPSGRPAQGAGRNIPIEDTRGAAGDSQPSANQADTGTGDLKVRIDVQVPKAMNEGQKKAMEDFLAATTDDVRSWQ